MKSTSAVVLAIAKAFTPIPELTTPLNIDTDTAVVQMAVRPHETFNACVSALYFEDQWKTARTNTNSDTIKIVNQLGNTPVCDRLRRREYHTDKFVFSWDPPKV
ncbi:MAG: hypothetical protein HYS17_10835 [Micavibrio aeruginosavorus]|uniref:Uncharacterized protein n=1 Tax=Micavibrio aeruginosavorus TaxID=349221 RepID=A0A7T5R210_9BACT|nr:MAG: hypothetical protein HYS17_10835 [Micavibrio aeruginosavorus]